MPELGTSMCQIVGLVTKQDVPELGIPTVSDSKVMKTCAVLTLYADEFPLAGVIASHHH